MQKKTGSSQAKSSVYSIQVSGIRCTNCASKITTRLYQNRDVQKVNVNVIHQKVIVSLKEQLVIPDIVDTLTELGFTVIGCPLLIASSQQIERVLVLEFTRNLEEHFKGMAGVVESKQKGDRCHIKYNPEVVRGRELTESLQKEGTPFLVINERVQAGKVKNRMVSSRIQVVECILLAAYFFVVMVLTSFEQFQTIMCYPGGSIFSYLLLLSMFLTLYTFMKYGRKYIVSSYINFSKFHSMNMETLISLGALSALSLFLFQAIRFSAFKTGHNQQHQTMELTDSLVSSTLIILTVTIGKHIQRRIKMNIQRTTQQIFPQSELYSNTSVDWVELRNRKLMILRQKSLDVVLVEKHQVIRLREGRLLLDVILMDGEAYAIDSILTGNQDVVRYTKGDRIKSGSIITKVSNCLAEVESVFQKSALVEIGAQINMVATQQQHQETGIQAVCQKVAFHFVKGVISISLLVGGVWLILINMGVSVPDCDVCWVVQRMIGVLVASCPCALGLAVPTVLAISLNIAYKNGILIRKNSVFENGNKCLVVAFDKTGTLFVKVNQLSHRVVSTIYSESQLWEVIAIVQKGFRHPIAEFLYKEALSRSKVEGSNFKFSLTSQPQQVIDGVKASIQHKQSGKTQNIKIGNKMILQNTPEGEHLTNKLSGGTLLYLAIDDVVCMELCLNTHSNLRPETRSVIDQIRRLGKQVHILSGDSNQSVTLLGDSLGLPLQWLHSQQSPTMKKQWITQMQSDGKGVMMVGDGLNDILCLRQSLVGVSINAKSQMNLNAASVVLMSESLSAIPILLKLVAKSRIFIYVNLMWALLYNVIMLPVVSGALFYFGVYISPVCSSLAMSVSSLVVVTFSQLLKCSKLRGYGLPLVSQGSRLATQVPSEFKVLNQQI